MKNELAPPAFAPPLHVRTGATIVDIATLDEALAFALHNPHLKGDFQGMIRRLEAAGEPEDVVEAGNAFRWWAEANGIVIEPNVPGPLAASGSARRGGAR